MHNLDSLSEFKVEPRRLERSPSGFIGEKVEPPTLKEELNDEIPYLG
jgi:hypothetical protein